MRQSSLGYGVAAVIHENIYEIPIPDRETLERIWPAIVKVRTPGSPLTLSRFDPAKKGGLFSNSQPAVRIYAPANGVSHKKGHELRAGPPWPKEIVGKNGELPMYVVAEEDKAGQLHWVPRSPKQARDAKKLLGFFYRVRTDVELVVDGKIIDLNRIALPDGVTIIDHRFSHK